MNAGATLDFGKAEVYWPQDEDSSKYQTLLDLNTEPKASEQSTLQPTFDAKVRIDAQIDVLVTPEVGHSCLGTLTDPVKEIFSKMWTNSINLRPIWA